MFHVFTDACRKNNNSSNKCNSEYPAQMQILYGGSTVKKDLNIFFY